MSNALLSWMLPGVTSVSSTKPFLSHTVCASYSKHFLCTPLWKTSLSGSVVETVTSFSLGGLLSSSNGFLSWFSLSLLISSLSCFSYALAGSLRDCLFDLLFGVGVGFNVGAVDEHGFRRQISCCSNLFEYPVEYFLHRARLESMLEIVANR